MPDWFRQKTWSQNQEIFFFKKLASARKDGRAQYLKIQAIELIDTGNILLLDVAEKLINKLFIDYPDDNFNRLDALFALGNIYKCRNDYEKAMDIYKQAIDFERIYPQVKTPAYLNYAELIIKDKRTDLYNEAEHILSQRIDDVLFPVEKYKLYSILSAINIHKKNKDQARHFAALADENANMETSGLMYHKYLGVVKFRESWLDKLVKFK